jgi:hypothetical protein
MNRSFVEMLWKMLQFNETLRYLPKIVRIAVPFGSERCSALEGAVFAL